MARIAFILLCHRDPEAVIAQARALTAAGDHVALHYDARAAGFARIAAAFRDDPDVALAARVRCGWGEWSLVRAALNAVETALAAFPRATHLYLVSGDCRPIKSAVRARAVLDARDVDHIESVDFFASGWIRTGPVEERLAYRHWFNERGRRRLFYLSLEWQKRLGLRRGLPAGLEMRIGSQWWCLRRSTAEAVMAFRRDRPDAIRFFRTTWIPDETFFQTLVAHLVPRTEISPVPPTFLAFTDYGMPATFHDDHHDLLVGQPELFARKIGPEARVLRDRLDALWASGEEEAPSAADGRRLFAFLTGRGRVGRRFGPRAWEAGATLGPQRTLVAIVCRDRAAGRALARAARAAMPALGYAFDEEAAGLPDLGGLERGLDKRRRHRRSFLRLVFDRLGTDRMAICVDPSDSDLLRDVEASGAALRVLLLADAADPAALRTRAERDGLIGPGTAPEATAEVLALLEAQHAEEAARLREAGPARVTELPAGATRAVAARALGEAFACDAETACAMAAEAGLPRA